MKSLRGISILSSSLKGYVLAALAAFIWGSQGIISKMVMVTGINPVSTAAIKISFAAITYVLFVLFIDPKLLIIQKKDIPFI
jgi:drug/metabolite transporter (DMT)-like permease